jgi:hypothetical protein
MIRGDRSLEINLLESMLLAYSAVQHQTLTDLDVRNCELLLCSRVPRVMRTMAPGRNTIGTHPQQMVSPCLLRDMDVERPNQDFAFYNGERPRQSLGNWTPYEVYAS